MEGWDEQWAWLQGTWANRVVGHALALGRKVPSQCLEALWKPSCLFPGLWYPGQLPAHTMLLCIFKCAPPNRPNRLPIPLGTGLEERIVGWKNSCLCPVRRVHVYRTQPGQQCAWLCWNGLL